MCGTIYWVGILDCIKKKKWQEFIAASWVVNTM